MSRVLLLGNSEIVIYNLRLELIKRLLSEGHEVIFSCPNISGEKGQEKIDELIKLGCRYEPVTINRHGLNVLQELNLYKYYKNLIKKTTPNIIYSYTIKPNIYGAFAAKKYKVPFVANVTGLGIALEKPGLLQKTLVQLYKSAFKNVQTIFFQNEKNKQFFVKHNISINKHKMLPGSGVNLNHFHLQKYPSTAQKISFVFIARIMKDKGIDHYLEAAKYIKKKYPETEFNMYGFIEDDYQEIIEEYTFNNIVEYHGTTNDIRKVFETTHCTILPSYHEGMANVLLESASSGRPVLASDIPGCRETFIEGASGFGFEPKNTEALIASIEKFIKLSHEDKLEMGVAGRKHMERNFDRQIVVDHYIEELGHAIS